MSPAEVELRFESGRWRALGPGVDLEHSELRGLDALITAAFAVPGGPSRVHVRFDLDGLPRWLRQYHAHYCNYVLRVHTPPG